MEENKLRLENTPFSIREIAKSSVVVVSTEAEKKGLILNINLDDKIPSNVIGDPTRVRKSQFLEKFSLIYIKVKFSSTYYRIALSFQIRAL